MNRLEHAGLKAAVRTILENPLSGGLDWSLQGMGMLRLRLAPDVRLHIWNSKYQVPGVSMIHDHQQWNLQSTIVAGALCNYRYIGHADGKPYHYRTLRAGYGCHFIDDAPSTMQLMEVRGEFYGPGDTYAQDALEIHRTDAQDGTVTIMSQERRDSDRARVFWLATEEWGSAEPRPATADEVFELCGHALTTWFQ